LYSLSESLSARMGTTSSSAVRTLIVVSRGRDPVPMPLAELERCLSNLRRGQESEACHRQRRAHLQAYAQPMNQRTPTGVDDRRIRRIDNEESQVTPLPKLIDHGYDRDVEEWLDLVIGMVSPMGLITGEQPDMNAHLHPPLTSEFSQQTETGNRGKREVQATAQLEDKETDTINRGNRGFGTNMDDEPSFAYLPRGCRLARYGGAHFRNAAVECRSNFGGVAAALQF
jgi:hypothetical protein